MEGRSQNGFTLVELSIVLVIIGLLISGVLVGRSMIETAKVSKTIKLLQQVHWMAYDFKQKFRYYPGDLPTAYTYFGANCGTNTGPFSYGGGSLGCNGTGDGIVNWGNPNNEITIATMHLYHGGYIKEPLVHYNSSPVWVPGVTGITTPYDEVSLAVVASNTYNPVSGPYALQMGKNSTGGCQPLCSGALTPKTLLAIDIKMDDSIPDTGKIMGRLALYINCVKDIGAGVLRYKPEESGEVCQLFSYLPAEYDN